MAFGRVGSGEFGTYFIGYASTPSVIELMLRHMFVGDPPGNHDRLLDFSTATTGNLYFVPTAAFLDDLPPSPAVAGADESAEAAATSAAAPAAATAVAGDAVRQPADGSLRIGDLRG